MTNQEMLNEEISETLHNLKRKREESSLFAESDSFPKPVMVYNNPNFKPAPVETVLKKQKPSKRVVSPKHNQNPGLFLNKESGSSFVDKQRRMYFNPETGAQFGEPQPASTGFNRIHSAANFYPRAYVSEMQGRSSHIEQAKYVLRKNASEQRAFANHKEGSFNTRFKQFYDKELKYDPKDIEAAGKLDMLQKSSTTSLTGPKKVSFVGETSPKAYGHPGTSAMPRDQISVPKLSNPKALYKISSKPATARLVHQPNPHKREAFHQYQAQVAMRQKELDSPIRLAKHEPPTWNDIVALHKGLEGVTSYTETMETRKLFRPMADPEDIDD